VNKRAEGFGEVGAVRSSREATTAGGPTTIRRKDLAGTFA
jgi:hypothetical protein